MQRWMCVCPSTLISELIIFLVSPGEFTFNEGSFFRNEEMLILMHPGVKSWDAGAPRGTDLLALASYILWTKAC